MKLEDLKLVQNFKNLYCLYSVVQSVEHEITETILSSLPIEITKTIDTVDIDSDGDEFLVLDISMPTYSLDDVYYAVKKVYPDFDWRKEKHQNFSNVYLRLDDDVIAYLPTLLYEV